MSNRKSKSASKTGLIMFILVGVLAVGGLAAYVKMAPADKVPADVHRDRQPTHAPDVSIDRQDPIHHDQVWVYAPEGDQDAAFVRTKMNLPVGSKPEQYAVEQFLETSHILEPGMRLINVVVEDGLAKVMFNDEIKNLSLGSSAESTFLKGISMSLSQFKDVKQMQFFANGEKVDAIGNVDLSEPIPLDTSAKLATAPSKP